LKTSETTDPGKAVKDVDEIPGVEVIDGTFTIDLKGVFVHFDIDGTPPNVVFGRVFIDDTLVFWTATGLFTGKVDQSTSCGDDGTFVTDSVFVELSDGCVTLEVNSGHVETGL
jgi:hypothetical protein